MNPFLGPLDPNGDVPARQQTRVAAFLMSAHGALARRLAVMLPARLHQAEQVELHAQYCREVEIVSLLAHATSWLPDPALAWSIWRWETAWLPQPAAGAADLGQGLMIDLAAFGHALHAALRPAALLPEAATVLAPFALALNRIELDSGRLIQGQIMFLKSPELSGVRDTVEAALERRHRQLRALWDEMLRGLDVEISDRHLVKIAFQTRTS